jgi:hypothetical protein
MVFHSINDQYLLPELSIPSIFYCPFQTKGWHLYLPDQHALAKLDHKDTRTSIRAELLPVIDIQEGIAIRLVAEHGKTSAKYENAASLVWRDAGVLIGHMSLTAEALACNFCPLGITGHEWCQIQNCMTVWRGWDWRFLVPDDFSLSLLNGLSAPSVYEAKYGFR